MLSSQKRTNPREGIETAKLLCQALRVLQHRTPGLLALSAAKTGRLALFDLANVGSVCHVLTEDLGVREDGAFRLLGRASGAELRGCSLTAEELGAM